MVGGRRFGQWRHRTFPSLQKPPLVGAGLDGGKAGARECYVLSDGSARMVGSHAGCDEGLRSQGRPPEGNDL